MGSGTAHLDKARVTKDDEFYTKLSDVERELAHYTHHFAGKTVYCNCDNPEWSAFWKYFHLNYEKLGLRELISTHYETSKPTYKMSYTGGNDMDITAGVKTPLMGCGDFRSVECVEILKSADLVVTNPPFSLFRDFVGQLMNYDKQFLIIGNKNSVTYKEFFPLLRDDRVWIGYTSPEEYDTPSGATKKINGLSRWFTNLDIPKRHEKPVFHKMYTPEEYPRYDNFDAINVNKTADIPVDYYGVMGVPITYLDKHNSDEFELLDTTQRWSGMRTKRYTKDEYKEASDMNSMWVIMYPDGFKMGFKRLLIRRKPAS